MSEINELNPREVIESRDGTRGRLYQADGVRFATVNVGHEGVEYGLKEPFYLIPGSAIVCKVDENGRFTVTRTEGVGS